METMGNKGDEVMAYYEFKVVQDNGVEIVMRVMDGDKALPKLMDDIEAFLIAAGFHQDTIDECLK